MTRHTPTRQVHALAWWGWALGLLVAAGRTANPLLLGLILAVLALVVAARRPDAPWGRAFAVSLRLGAIVLVSRMLLQILLGAPVGSHPAFTLPTVPLPDWMAGVRLGGLVTWETMLVGACEGLRLAVMIACVGAANSLVAPSRLLRSVPAALYEIGVAIVVALTFAPRLIDDSRRISAARRMRGHEEGRLAAFARSAGPVLDSGLQRSVELAAAMDSRGYGRAGLVSVRERRTQVVLVLAGFTGSLVGLYGLLDTAAPRVLGWPMLAAGLLLAVLGVHEAGRRSIRSTYRPDRWHLPEWLTLGSGALVAGAFLATSTITLALSYAPLALPDAPLPLVLAIALAAGPAFWTPTPPGGPR